MPSWSRPSTRSCGARWSPAWTQRSRAESAVSGRTPLVELPRSSRHPLRHHRRRRCRRVRHPPRRKARCQTGRCWRRGRTRSPWRSRSCGRGRSRTRSRVRGRSCPGQWRVRSRGTRRSRSWLRTWRRRWRFAACTDRRGRPRTARFEWGWTRVVAPSGRRCGRRRRQPARPSSPWPLLERVLWVEWRGRIVRRHRSASLGWTGPRVPRRRWRCCGRRRERRGRRGRRCAELCGLLSFLP